MALPGNTQGLRAGSAGSRTSSSRAMFEWEIGGHCRAVWATPHTIGAQCQPRLPRVLRVTLAILRADPFRHPRSMEAIEEGGLPQSSPERSLARDVARLGQQFLRLRTTLDFPWLESTRTMAHTVTGLHLAANKFVRMRNAEPGNYASSARISFSIQTAGRA